MLLEPGQKLSHYLLVKRIGEGGMGVVWKARDEKLRRDVALKVLPPDLVSDGERRRRLVREARAEAAVNHPNVASVFDVDEDGGHVFIAMEYVQGTSLRSVLYGKAFRLLEAIDIAAEIGEGLAGAHAAGLVHRDLKPENVMVRPDGHVKILDFGLAKLCPTRELADGSRISQAETRDEEQTPEGRVVGTPAYMSPEQARGDPLDARSDIFSLGCILYEMVTSSRPFEGRSRIETLSAVLRDPPRAASDLNQELPPELDRLLGKCLEKNPRDRYQHADELVVDLRRLRNEQSSGPSASYPAFGAKAEPRRLPRWGLAALIALVVLAAVLATVQLSSWLGNAPSGSGSITSLAVLPLANLSGDSEQDYFADGVTEALIADLAKISALRVVSRTSSMRYRETNKTIAEIARDLSVDALVEGSVMRADDEVRITVRLMQPVPERQLWADSYHRELRDILNLQGEVARAIAAQIQIVVTPEEITRLARDRPVDPEAHEAYLQGRYWHAKAGAGFRKAERYFLQAVEIDPDYAPAYAALAHTYVFLDLEKARVMAMKALELDDTLGQAHTSFARVLWYRGWEWVAAESEFQQALRLSPGNAGVHAHYAQYLRAVGRHEESLAEAKRARELDPASPGRYAGIGRAYYYDRKYPEAIEQYRLTLETVPNHHEAHVGLGLAQLEVAMYEEAKRAFRRALEICGGDADEEAMLGYAHALAGDRAEALEILAKATDSYERSEPKHAEFGIPYFVAVLHAALGDADRAFIWLERAYEDRVWPMVYLKVDPLVDRLRSDPRFQTLLRRMNYPE